MPLAAIAERHDRREPVRSHPEAARRILADQLPILRLVARGLTRDPAELEDLVQDAFEKAPRAIDAMDLEANPRGWMVTILHNLHIDRCRRRARMKPHVPCDELAIPAPEVTEAPVWSAISTDDVRRAAARLPEELRTTYTMFALEGRSYTEVAEALGIPKATVGTRLSRARAAEGAAHGGARGAGRGRWPMTPSPCDLLALYVDGELDPAEAERFALHLAECETCPAQLHEALQLVALEAAARLAPGAPAGGSRESAPAPEPADPIPITRVRRAPRATPRVKAGLAVAAFAAAAAVVAYLAVARRGGPGPGTDPGTDPDLGPVAIATAPDRSRAGSATAAPRRTGRIA